MSNETLFDVLAVNIETSAVKFMGQGKTAANAEAIEKMAIMRRFEFSTRFSFPDRVIDAAI